MHSRPLLSLFNHISIQKNTSILHNLFKVKLVQICVYLWECVSVEHSRVGTGQITGLYICVPCSEECSRFRRLLCQFCIMIMLTVVVHLLSSTSPLLNSPFFSLTSGPTPPLLPTVYFVPFCTPVVRRKVLSSSKSGCDCTELFPCIHGAIVCHRLLACHVLCCRHLMCFCPSETSWMCFCSRVGFIVCSWLHISVIMKIKFLFCY